MAHLISTSLGRLLGLLSMNSTVVQRQLISRWENLATFKTFELRDGLFDFGN